uniref:Bm10855 n=1 Tax=Brugia malayi TaxID=6279 RepID=A0A1I9G4J5_BRUMA|nr:Bm10855 [Brugia malayi]
MEILNAALKRETCADRFDSSSSNLNAAVFAQEGVQLQQQFSGALE